MLILIQTNNNLSKCVKVNPAGVKSVEFSNGYPPGRYFDISVQQLNGQSSATLNVNKDTIKVSIYENGAWTDIYTLATKSDLLNLSRTLVSGDSFSDVKDLSIPPGIYGVNPGLKNAPEKTYGLLEVTADAVNNWRFLKFTPTNIKSHYLMFYNGYDKTWSEWVHFTSTT